MSETEPVADKTVLRQWEAIERGMLDAYLSALGQHRLNPTSDELARNRERNFALLTSARSGLATAQAWARAEAVHAAVLAVDTEGPK